MHNLTALTLSALLAFALFPTPAAATDNHFIGTWAGVLDAEHQRELTVRHVGPRRIVTGWYCIRGPGVHRITDFHANGSRDGAVQARATKTKLTTTIGDFKITATVNRDRDTAKFIARSTKRKVEYDMHPSEPAAAPCRPRIVPLPVAGVADDDRPAGETFADGIAAADPDTHPFIGSWVGQRPNGLAIELNVTVIDSESGAVTGLYCNTWASGWRGRDMDHNILGGIHATASQTELTFERNDRRFHFVLDGPDTMTYTQTIPEQGSQTLALVRTSDPVCAARVIVPTT